MFDSNILEPDGEIPKVFRCGLLSTDSNSSISRLMDEFGREEPRDDIHNRRIQEEFAKLKESINKSPFNEEKKKGYKRKDSDNTSENSLMDETPSNYNLPNNRFDPNKV